MNVGRLQMWIDRLWLVSGQRWLFIASSLCCVAGASTVTALASGTQTGVVGRADGRTRRRRGRQTGFPRGTRRRGRHGVAMARDHRRRNVALDDPVRRAAAPVPHADRTDGRHTDQRPCPGVGPRSLGVALLLRRGRHGRCVGDRGGHGPTSGAGQRGVDGAGIRHARSTDPGGTGVERRISAASDPGDRHRLPGEGSASHESARFATAARITSSKRSATASNQAGSSSANAARTWVRTASAPSPSGSPEEWSTASARRACNTLTVSTVPYSRPRR